jgi:hypothetical protein
VGDLLEPEYISNNQLVLAVLKEKIISYDNSYENIVPLMDPLMKNSLKAKYFFEKFSKKLDSAKSIDMVSEITGNAVQTKFVKYSDVNIGNNTQELPEPKVIANIFSLNPEEISTIIEGKKGLYIVQCQKTNNQNRFDENTIIEKAQSEEKEIRTLIEQGYYPALYNSYKVIDGRAKNMILNN